MHLRAKARESLMEDIRGKRTQTLNQHVHTNVEFDAYATITLSHGARVGSNETFN